MARRPKLSKQKPDWARALEVRRIKLGLSQDLASEAGGLSQAYYSEVERGERELTSLTHSKLLSLARALQWSLGDLEKATGVDLGVVTAWTLAGQPTQTLNPLSDVHRVPVIALASAGAPVDDTADERIIGWEYLDDDQYRAHMLVLEVDGESMNNGHADSLQHGDRLYVDTRDLTLQDGKIYVVHVHGNGIVVKRARKLGAEWWLFSDNSNFAPVQPDSANIIGRVYFHQPRGKKL